MAKAVSSGVVTVGSGLPHAFPRTGGGATAQSTDEARRYRFVTLVSFPVTRHSVSRLRPSFPAPPRPCPSVAGVVNPAPARPRMTAFDLDDTLAPSKAPLPDPVRDALLRLLEVSEVCVISGGQVEQFRTQLVARLGALPGRARRAPPPHADLRHAVLAAHLRRAHLRLRGGPDRRREAPRDRRRRGGGEAAGALGRRDLGAGARGPGLADHVLGARAAGAARREEGVGPDRGEEEPPPRGRAGAACRTSRCAAAGPPPSTSPGRASTRRTACDAWRS